VAPICPLMRAVADRADRSARVSDLIRGGASDRRVRGQHKMLGLARFAEANDLYHSAGGGVTGSGVADGGTLIGEVPALFDIAIDDIERLSHAGIVLPRRAEGMPYARVDLPLRRAHRAIAMDEQYRAATPTPQTPPIPDRRRNSCPWSGTRRAFVWRSGLRTLRTTALDARFRAMRDRGGRSSGCGLAAIFALAV
jgi:hypothetical protein